MLDTTSQKNGSVILGRQVYRYAEYKIFKVGNGYVVHNTLKPFKYGHTHITDFNTAKYIVHLSKFRIIPKHLSLYLWNSLERVSTGKEYRLKIRCVIDELVLGGIKK